MARGLNRLTLIGCLAHAPELRYTPAGLAVLEFTLAGDDRVVTAEGEERTLPWYHRVTLLGTQAEALAELPAGTAMLVEGCLEHQSWESPEGEKRSRVRVKANRAELLGREAETVADSGGGLRLVGALNEVLLVGNLTREPELRYTGSGTAVLDLGLAVNESWKGTDGEWKERVHFLTATAWRELAEFAAGLSKGAPVLVKGRLVAESWTDREGNKRSSTKVEVSRLEALARPGKVEAPEPVAPAPRAKAAPSRRRASATTAKPAARSRARG